MKQHSDWAASVSWVLLVLTCAVIFILGLKHRQLRNDFLDHRRADGRLQAGMYVPSFGARSVTSDSLVVGTHDPHGRQVVIFLTASCPFCQRSLPSWKGLASRLEHVSNGRPATRLIALTTDSAQVAASYARAHGLSFPLVSFPSRKLTSLYRGYTVPQTVVLDSDGRVLLARHEVIESQAAVDSVFAVVNSPVPRRGDSTSLRPPRVGGVSAPRVALRGRV